MPFFSLDVVVLLWTIFAISLSFAPVLLYIIIIIFRIPRGLGVEFVKVLIRRCVIIANCLNELIIAVVAKAINTIQMRCKVTTQ